MLDQTQRGQTLALYMILGLLSLRLFGLLTSPLGLHGDEAQYWAWSKDLAWGYVTKPPLIAVIIAASTSVFGDAEWAVRLASPITHSITAWVIFSTARHVYDARTGFWASAIFLLMPAVWLSSGIISTDVPLLLCWALALNAWVHLRDHISGRRMAQLGLAIGLGILAKYAMVFIIAAFGLTIIFDPDSRRAFLNRKIIIALVITGTLVVPNLMWNFQNEMATFTHTAANANLGSTSRFHLSHLAAFWRDQAVVYGPVSIVALGAAIKASFKHPRSHPSLALACITLTPLLIISAQALLSRSNANWAVTGYISASILTAHFIVKLSPKIKTVFKRGFVVQTLTACALALVILSPSLTDSLGLANSVKRLRKWPETVTQLQSVFAQGHDGHAFRAVALDKRIIYYDLKYYGLDKTVPLYMWRHRAHAENQAELTAPLPAHQTPVLLVNYYPDYEDKFQDDFERLAPLPALNIDLGGGKKRHLKLWAGYGYTPTQTR